MRALLDGNSTPAAILAVSTLAILVALWWRGRGAPRKAIKHGALAAMSAYLVLCAAGLFVRAWDGRWRPAWPGDPTALASGRHEGSDLGNRHLPAAVVNESCVACHGTMTGLGEAHRPEVVGCASCHGGHGEARDATIAHADMVKVPGNLADAPRTCGRTGCHDAIVPRVERSIMTTLSGVIAVDRRVFGQTGAVPDPLLGVRDLGTTAADTHLRQLCASCHLGQTKASWGPITEQSRGGGCNACHLVYSSEAATLLVAYETTPARERKEVPRVHPSLSVNVDNGHCFGCHSRSSRISTSYEGWHELNAPPGAAAAAAMSAQATSPFRQLQDGRFFMRMTPDVHQERGLDCIDCHTATEIMGTGMVARRKHEQEQIRCEDCHTQRFATIDASAADEETQRILRLRETGGVVPTVQLALTRSGAPLVNVRVDSGGKGTLLRKRTGNQAKLQAPASACVRGRGHQRLSCSACHTAWAPRCVSCHTSFDAKAEAFDHVAQDWVKGAWQETPGIYRATAPTLGVRLDAPDAARPTGIIETFTPGMIMELDRTREVGSPPDAVFTRLYARIAAHTTRREARSCESCHDDPVALGYGEGALRYVVKAATGRWEFLPRHERLAVDGLPEDAWIGFLQTRDGMVSTRDDVRPFDVEEQQRILRVGACLTCHAGNSAVMQRALDDFEGALQRRSSRCVLPVWK